MYQQRLVLVPRPLLHRVAYLEEVCSAQKSLTLLRPPQQEPEHLPVASPWAVQNRLHLVRDLVSQCFFIPCSDARPYLLFQLSAVVYSATQAVPLVSALLSRSAPA